MKTVNHASPQKPQVNAPPPLWLEVPCNSSIHEARAILWLMATLDTGGEVPKNDERSDVESVGARFIAPHWCRETMKREHCSPPFWSAR